MVEAKDLAFFSGNTEEFIKELGTYMKQTKNKKLIEAFNQFEKRYVKGVFKEAEISRIIKTSNLLIDRKLKANPFFKDYLLGLTQVKNTKESPKHFQQWHQVIDQLLETPNKSKIQMAKKLLAFSPTFFEKHALKKGKGQSYWYVRNATYDILYEADKPCIRFQKLNLVTINRKDSLQILETSGSFCPLSGKWKGQGGKVLWNKEGMKDVYCSLMDYEMKLEKGAYEINNVELHYPSLFPGQTIKGRLKNKIVRNNKTSEGSYPRFESTEKVLEINNIGERVNYIGGFRLHGSTYLGYGDATQKAEIEIFNGQNEMVFKGRSAVFNIRKGERISGAQVEAVLFYGKDTIYHPSVNLKYDMVTKKLNLYRGERGSDRGPFYDSYHKVNIDTDKLDWDIDAGQITINQKNAKFGNGNQRVTFESLQYFDVQTYRKFQNVSTTNPIATLHWLARTEKKNIFSAKLLAKKINPRFDVENIKSLLYDLLADGFIEYDAERQLVTVKDKTFHFADASQKKKDFDLIKYVSDSEKTNALLDLETKELITRNVGLVEFSNRQKVAAKPFEGDVTLLNNRNLNFAGKLFAGYATFNGKDFNFNYQKNSIKVDSLRFFDLFVPTGKVINNEPEALSIASRIEHTNGVLLIDAPTNKSGLQDIPMFPSFTTQGSSYVFYDKKETQDACYSRDSFYFELDPFSLNDLDQFTADDLRFKGTMVSAGIFPEIKEELVLQEEDQSLGFVNETPSEGLPVYNEKGKFTGAVTLNNKGFIANGQINYNWATIQSEEIILKPKQLLTSAENFNLEEDRNGAIEIPKVVGQQVDVDWKPYQDSMFIQSYEAPFQLFQSGNYTLKNMLILTPDGLKGRGIFDWEKGNMTAQLYSIGARSIQADTVNLKIKTTGLDHLALDTRNVFSKLDFDKQIGTVGANADTVQTILPYNTYITSLNEFDWDMKNETLTFKADENGRGSFRSINPEQDSLRFYGKTAFYDLKTYELKLGGVTHIETADAVVYPKEGSLEIQKGGVMTTLHNARIVANRTNKYHVINRATVDVIGRKEYKAKGFYEYNVGDKQQVFELTSIVGASMGKGKKSKRKVKTVGSGAVKAGDRFYIDHKTLFQGKIDLDADQKALQFNGFAQLDVPLFPKNQWFSISSLSDKNDLQISFDEPKNLEGQIVRNGLFLNSLNAQLYPRVMMATQQRKDRTVFEAKGLMKYDQTNDQFLFGDSLKIVSGVPGGNLMTFDNQTGNLHSSGRFDIGSGLDYANLTVVGNLETNVQESTKPIRLEVVAGLELYVPEKLLKIILTDIVANGYEARDVKYLERKDFYNQVLADLIPAGKDYANTKAKMLNYGLELPEKYNPYTFLFTDLYLQWSPETQSFLSSRDRIGLCSLNGTAINKLLEGYLECKMPSNGNDQVYIYLQSPGGQFYYFDYSQGILNTVSDNSSYNEAVNGLKKKEQSIKMDDGELFEVQLTEQGRAKMFINRIKGLR